MIRFACLLAQALSHKHNAFVTHKTIADIAPLLAIHKLQPENRTFSHWQHRYLLMKKTWIPPPFKSFRLFFSIHFLWIVLFVNVKNKTLFTPKMPSFRTAPSDIHLTPVHVTSVFLKAKAKYKHMERGAHMLLNKLKVVFLTKTTIEN